MGTSPDLTAIGPWELEPLARQPAEHVRRPVGATLSSPPQTQAEPCQAQSPARKERALRPGPADPLNVHLLQTPPS